MNCAALPELAIPPSLRCMLAEPFWTHCNLSTCEMAPWLHMIPDTIQAWPEVYFSHSADILAWTVLNIQVQFVCDHKG